ncbi:MAG: hypothetical protein AAGB46_10360 [Verrucomicrobiota bacterium]
MELLKRNPLFFGALGLMLAVIIGGIWLTMHNRLKLTAVKTEYEANIRQLEHYLKRTIAPTRANLAALERNYEVLYKDFQKASAYLNLNTFNSDRFFGEAPGSRTEAFFAIASYVELARNLSANNEIAFAADSRFGFNAYSNKGPEEEDIERVHRQVKIMEWLIQAVTDSDIVELVRMQRGREAPEQTTRGRRIEKVDSDTFGDEFVVDAVNSLAIEGLIESETFRVAFKGQSLSLRNFLNRVVNSTLPFVVRGVEVELSNKYDERDLRGSVADNNLRGEDIDTEMLEAARVPIISENESLFVVTLEFLDMTAEIEAPRVELAEESEMEGADV